VDPDPGVLGLGQPPPGVDEGSGCGETVLPRRMPGMEGVRLRSVAARHGHCLALDVDGRVLSWGGGRGGQLGHGNEEDQLTPRLMAALQGTRVRGVDAGTGHSVAVSEGGALFTWGGFISGSCGLGYRAENGIQVLPRRVTGALAGQSVASVAAGAGFSLAVTESGGVWSFGCGETGQLGHGVVGQVIQPREVEALAGLRVRALAAGSSHALGLTEAGVVYSWGSANSGRESLLGRKLRGGGADAALAPVEGMAGEHVCSIAAGDMHSCALTERGELFTWGQEEWGRLGHFAVGGVRGRRRSVAGFAPLPKRVKAPAGWRLVSVSAGAFHTLAVAGDGAVFGWGDNRNGCISSEGAVEPDSRLSRCPWEEPHLIAELRANPEPCARLM
jgi:alpha-tubulin suppressor-like RCC1 family protein